MDRSAPPSALVVQNNRLEDSWVYLGHEGGSATRKLGMARGLHTDTLLVPASELAPGTRIHFVAIAFHGGPAFTDASDNAVAERGVLYLWSLGPQRGANFLWQRAAE